MYKDTDCPPIKHQRDNIYRRPTIRALFGLCTALAVSVPLPLVFAVQPHSALLRGGGGVQSPVLDSYCGGRPQRFKSQQRYSPHGCLHSRAVLCACLYVSVHIVLAPAEHASRVRIRLCLSVSLILLILLSEINLVADHNNWEKRFIVHVAQTFRAPQCQLFDGLVVIDVVDKKRPVSAAVERAANSTLVKTFLPCGIPHLQDHVYIVDLDLFS